MKELNPNLRPPGGYRFVDANGVTHDSDKISTLAEIVGRHRERAGFAVGNPMADILDQICGKYPRFCREVQAPGVPAEKTLAITVAHRIRQEIMHPPSERNVDSDEAARRAAICAACPHRVNWAEKCPPCLKSVQKYIRVAVRPAQLQPDTEHFSCKLGLDSIAIVVYRSKMKKLLGAPARCWRAE
jgi:hypothetical protein